MGLVSVVFFRNNFNSHKLEAVFEQFSNFQDAQLRQHALMQLGIRSGIIDNRRLEGICTVKI